MNSDADPSLPLKIPWIILIAFLLTLMGAGYVILDGKKADRESVNAIRDDVREIRTFLMGPRR